MCLTEQAAYFCRWGHTDAMFILTAFTRRLTAMTFLVVFLNVTVGQCLCAVAGPRPVAVAPASPAHPGCKGHAAPKPAAPANHGRHGQAGHQDHHDDRHKEPKGHDCCKDKSASVLAGLSAPSIHKLAPDTPQWLSTPPVLSYSFARFTAWDRARPVLLVPPQHLPPKIPDIRIYIQSLTV